MQGKRPRTGGVVFGQWWLADGWLPEQTLPKETELERCQERAWNTGPFLCQWQRFMILGP